MIDIHSHILPGIDDGAETMADSLQMAREAVKQGIQAIIATPHHQNGHFNNERKDILRYVSNLNERLQQEDIPLTVLPGQETRINGDMLDELNNEVLLPLNETKYLFVEFPFGSVPRYAKQMLFDIQVAGCTPIIVHPERNRAIAEDPSLLYDFIRTGALSQITAASLTGELGKSIQKLSHQLIDANLSHFLASDAHNTTTRGFVLKEAFDELRDQHGTGMFYTLMENSQLLIDNQNVFQDEPQHVKKKKFLGLF